MIIVEAQILEYIPNVFHDLSKDGGFVAYNGTNIKVLAPEMYEGKKYTILHYDEYSDTSVWKTPESVIKFKIDPGLLPDRDQIFLDAIEIVK